MEKSLAKEMCIKFKSEEISTTGGLKIAARERGAVVCVACRRRDSESDDIDCQQGEAKRSQDRGFVTDCNRCEKASLSLFFFSICLQE